MQNQINLTIPINSLGYGMHALGYYKVLKDAGYDVTLNKIGSRGLESNISSLLANLGLLDAVEEDQEKKPFDAPNLMVWHPNQMSQFLMKGVPNIGAGAFELEPVTQEEQDGFSSVDVAVTYSDWGISQIDNPNKIKVYGPTWSTYGLEIDNVHQIPGTEGKTTYLSPGKWEKRKGHPEFVDILTTIALEGQEFVVLGFWNNIFTGHLSQPLAYLTKKGWAIDNMFNIHGEIVYTMKLNDSIITLFGHVEKYTNLLGYYHEADAAITLSKGEGWDMPIVDLLGLGIPVLMTDNTAHSEYVNPDYCISKKDHMLEKANDGVFFKGQGNWYNPNLQVCENKIRDFMTHDLSQFWPDDYTAKFDIIKDPKTILLQLETAITMSEQCHTSK